MVDTIIIGGGVAGLTAAIYTARAGKKTVIIEQKACGGQILTTPSIENYPAIKNISGYEFVQNLINQVKSFGTIIKNENTIKVDSINDVIYVQGDKAKYAAKTLIIATGVESCKLNLENDEKSEKEKKYVGRGVSYCAVCDGMFFKNKTVTVVGGGNTALEDALYLSDICSRVHIVHRRDTFRGENILFEKLREKSNVDFVLEHTVCDIAGDDSVTQITVKSTVNGQKQNISTDGLFVAIGKTPVNSIFENIVKLENGYIKTDENMQTSKKGIYAAGDCRYKTVRQLSTAAADGTIAAVSVINYLNSSS